MNPFLTHQRRAVNDIERIKDYFLLDFKNQFNFYTFDFHASIPLLLITVLFYREFHSSKRLLDVTGRLTILATKENFVKLCTELSKLTSAP